MNPALDLELIRTFLTVISRGGLKNAASHLNKTPSAISMQLKRLEEQLSHRLLDRSNQGIALTEAGRTLKKYGENLLRVNNDLLAELLQEELTGTIVFGAPTDYGPTLLQKLLPVLSIEFPKLEPRIVLEPSRVLRRKVASGEVDVAIAARERNSGEGLLLWKERLAWYGAPESESGTVRLAALSTDCVLRDETESALAEAEIRYQTVLTAAGVASLKDAVEAGFCNALLPVSCTCEQTGHYLLNSGQYPPVAPLEFALIASHTVKRSHLENLQRRLIHAL